MVVEAIKLLYPNAKVGVDFTVRDNGNGAFVSYWSESLGPQPTTEQIDALEPLLEKIALKNKIAAMRWDRETAGITIGTQPVSTLREEMPVWQGMLLDVTLQPGVRSEYEYKPRNGANVVLTPQQVQRSINALLGTCQHVLQPNDNYAMRSMQGHH